MQEEPRISIGYPLDPITLGMTEAYDEFPKAPAEFNPHGEWEHSYRIYGIHGYKTHPRSINATMGFLRIVRKNLTNNKLQLNITKLSMGDRGNVHELSCEMICEKDALGTPLSWTINNRFYDYYGQERKNVSYAEKGSAESGTVNIWKKNIRSSISVNKHFTSDWSLFEAVQRMDKSETTSKPFDVLFGLSVLRQEHRLIDRGKFIYAKDGDMREFDLLHEIGPGMVPYEYYLDDSHFLLAVFTMNVVYFYDPVAEDIFDQRLIMERQSTQRKVKQ